MRLLALASAGAFACAILSACDFDGSGLEIVPKFDDRFSFETDADMEEWDARGLDLDDPPITWEIARSTEQATEGAHAVRFRLDNLNDQGKIWIERRYEVAPDQESGVTITFDLVTPDFGTVHLWRRLAGAAPDAPMTAADLISSLDTGNGEPSDVGFQTVEKTVTVLTKSDEDGEMFVYVGIWGTSEFSRTYYVDDLHAVFMRGGLSAPSGPSPTAVF